MILKFMERERMHDALEEAQHAAHPVDPVKRGDKMHLRRAGIGKTHLDPAADQRAHQAFRITVCGCQPVERVTVAMVAPLGPHSSASTHACFEFARPVG
jgi:hypothetical protein